MGNTRLLMQKNWKKWNQVIQKVATKIIRTTFPHGSLGYRVASLLMPAIFLNATKVPIVRPSSILSDNVLPTSFWGVQWGNLVEILNDWKSTTVSNCAASFCCKNGGISGGDRVSNGVIFLSGNVFLTFFWGVQRRRGLAVQWYN